MRALPDRPVPKAEPLSDEEPGGTGQLAMAAPTERLVPEPVPAPRDPATASLLAAAMQAVTRDDWERALAALERAVKLAPDDAGLWYQLAYVHHRRGDHEQAVQTARRALSLPVSAAERARTWLLIAEVETARGDAAAAAAARAQAEP
ncbi:MAG: tetratricopeptide repeat protein [Gammaproteobacteria bacterium]